MLVFAIHKWHDLSVAIGSSRSGAGGNADAHTDTASHSGDGDTRGDPIVNEQFTFAGKEVTNLSGGTHASGVLW
jgi:hypothetical protein